MYTDIDIGALHAFRLARFHFVCVCVCPDDDDAVLASRSVLLNIPLAFVVIYVGYALYNRIIEQQRRAFEVKLNEFTSRFPSPDELVRSLKERTKSSGGHDIGDADWRDLVNCDELAKSWDDFSRLVTKDFVTDLFYSYITPDDELPENVVRALQNILGELSLRTRHVNIASLLLKDFIEMLEQHIAQYRATSRSVGNREWGGMTDEAQEAAYESHLLDTGALHPAARSSGDVEFRNLQMISQGLVLKLIPEKDSSCSAMRILLREILGTCVLKPIMDIFTPHYFNMFLLMLLDYECHAKIMKQVKDSSHTEDIRRRDSVAEAPSLVTKIAMSDETLDGTDEGDQAQDAEETSSSSSGQNNTESPTATPHKKEDRDEPEQTTTTSASSVPTPAAVNDVRVAAASVADEPMEVSPTKINFDDNYMSVVDNLFESRRRDLTGGAPPARLGTSVTNSMLSTNDDDDDVDEAYEMKHMGFDDDDDDDDDDRVFDDDDDDIDDEGNEHLSDNDDDDYYSESDMLPDCELSSDGRIYQRAESMDELRHVASTSTSDREGAMHARSASTGLDTGAPLKPKGRCTIAIVAAGIVHQDASNSFVAYRIRVTDGFTTWFVTRRYSNFEVLHKAMRDAVPGYKYRLPPKRILFHQLNGSFVESRKSMLERYLNQILRDDITAESDEVWRFLSMTRYVASDVSGPGMLRSVSRRIRKPMDAITRKASASMRRATRSITQSSRNSSARGSLSTAADGSTDMVDADPIVNRSRWSTTTTSRTSTAAADAEGGAHKRGVSADAILELWDKELARNSAERSGSVGAAPGFADSSYDDAYGSEAMSDEHPMSASCSSLPPPNDPSWNCDADDGTAASTPPEQSQKSGSGTETSVKTDLRLTSDLRGLGLNVVNLVDVIFQFGSRGWLKRQVLGVARQVLQMVLGNTIDSFIAARLSELCTGETVAKGVRYLQNVILWPDSVWFDNHPEKMTPEQWSEYARFAKSCVHLLLVDCAPPSLVSLIGKKQFRRCMNDVFYVVQSPLFMRQLGCNTVDLVVKAWFPELTPVCERNLSVCS